MSFLLTHAASAAGLRNNTLSTVSKGFLVGSMLATHTGVKAHTVSGSCEATSKGIHQQDYGVTPGCYNSGDCLDTCELSLCIDHAESLRKVPAT